MLINTILYVFFSPFFSFSFAAIPVPLVKSDTMNVWQSSAFCMLLWNAMATAVSWLSSSLMTPVKTAAGSTAVAAASVWYTDSAPCKETTL